MVWQNTSDDRTTGAGRERDTEGLIKKYWNAFRHVDTGRGGAEGDEESDDEDGEDDAAMSDDDDEEYEELVSWSLSSLSLAVAIHSLPRGLWSPTVLYAFNSSFPNGPDFCQCLSFVGNRRGRLRRLHAVTAWTVSRSRPDAGRFDYAED